jgi:hypothetical protein
MMALATGGDKDAALGRLVGMAPWHGGQRQERQGPPVFEGARAGIGPAQAYHNRTEQECMS